MSFLKFSDFFNKIKPFKKNKRRASRKPSLAEREPGQGNIENDISPQSVLQSEPILDMAFDSKFELKPEPRLEEPRIERDLEDQTEEQPNAQNMSKEIEVIDAFEIINREDQEEVVEDVEACPSIELIEGGIYGVREQQDTSYWLAKIVYIEDHFVHVLRYSTCLEQLTPELIEKTLVNGTVEKDGAFGADHLPLTKSFFIENSVYMQHSPLSEQDVQGYRLYADSVADCLAENAPEWLQGAVSYAIRRCDHKAMVALADRYLIGVDLPRDSKKALYWLNRLVHEGRNLVQPGEPVKEERQILTGGIYACVADDKTYDICKIVLKDKHGMQKLIFPSALQELPPDLKAMQLMEQTGDLVHASVTAKTFIAQHTFFIGILPITAAEIHCYRTHLQTMFVGADFQASALENLLRRAEAGDIWSQDDLAHLYLTGDPEWEVEKNIPGALRWFTEAANQGHGLAAYNLAVIYRQGEDVAADLELSLEWLIYAANLNCGLAQQYVADCYQHGDGCDFNSVFAHAWYSMAALADNDLPDEQKNRAEVNKKEIDMELSAEQRTKAQEYLHQLQDNS